MKTQPGGTGQTTISSLLVVPWDATHGGVMSVVGNLAKHLQAAGHQVCFFHSGDALVLKDKVTKQGFPGVELRLSLPFGSGFRGMLRLIALPLFVANLLQLIWFLQKRRIQIVNLHYPIDNFVYFAICRRLLPIKLVTSLHGSDAFYQERPKDNYSRVFRFLIHSSDLVVLPSDRYRRKFVTEFPRLRPRAMFIHNGVDPAQFRPAENGHQPDANNRYILCVADLQEYKAIDVLLNAAVPLLTSDRTLKLYSWAMARCGKSWKRWPRRWELRRKRPFSGREARTRSPPCCTAARPWSCRHGWNRSVSF